MESGAPPKPTLRVVQSKHKPARDALEKLDHLLVVVPSSLSPDRWPSLPAGKQLTALAAHTKWVRFPGLKRGSPIAERRRSA